MRRYPPQRAWRGFRPGSAGGAGAGSGRNIAKRWGLRSTATSPSKTTVPNLVRISPVNHILAKLNYLNPSMHSFWFSYQPA